MRSDFLFLGLVVLLAACGGVDESTEELGAEASVMAGVAALSGAAHMLNPAATGGITRTITACGQTAAGDTCSGASKKTASYVGCTTAENHTYEGSVELTFSTAGCAMTTINQLVTRLTNLTRTLEISNFPRFNGTAVATTTESHADYRGATIGGGTEIKIIQDVDPKDYAVKILGVHKILKNSKGKTLYDISIRTIIPLEFGATPPLSSARTFTNDLGDLEVNHNTAQYTAVFKPQGIVYNSASCCHPTSGTLNVTFDGKVVGTGVVTFTSTCGSVTLARDGQPTTPIVIHGCE